MPKGSVFERKIATDLSLWWSNGENDAIFWRTAGSGARATVRGRKGKATKNHAGDLTCIDPIGQPFLDFVTIEIKRGYSKYTLFDLMDKSPGSAKQILEEWIEQAYESHRQAESFSWIIIAKRDRREEMVIFPTELREAVIGWGGCPWLKINLDGSSNEIFSTTLKNWLKRVSPEQIIKLAK